KFCHGSFLFNLLIASSIVISSGFILSSSFQDMGIETVNFFLILKEYGATLVAPLVFLTQSMNILPFLLDFFILHVYLSGHLASINSAIFLAISLAFFQVTLAFSGTTT